MHRYTLAKKLGEGAFGDVRLALDQETGEKVAIKTFKARYSRMEQLLVEPEVKALRSLSHPNIIQCKEYIFEEGRSRAHLVFELMDMGSLERFCRIRKRPFSEDEVRSIFYQILIAIEYIHSLNFIHRDIKPENILLKRAKLDPIVKLADLGLAKNIGAWHDRPKTTYVATRWYRSPEILLRMRSYGKPSDMWAIGAVMAEVIAIGRPLFPGSNEEDQLRRVISLRGHPESVRWEEGARALNGRLNMPHVMPSSLSQYLPHASPTVLQLIEDLLEMDPLVRPTASDALHSSLFVSSPTITPLYSSLEECGNGPHPLKSPTQGRRDDSGQNFQKVYGNEVPTTCEKIRKRPRLQGDEEKNHNAKGSMSKFYIPPIVEESCLVYKNSHRLRSPAGSFNVAPQSV